MCHVPFQIGYCDGVKSVVNGSGLNDSVAGVKEEFSVYLNDIYQYPSPVEASILQVQISRQNDSYRVMPVIYTVLNSNGIFKEKLLVTLLYAIDYFYFYSYNCI